MPKNYKGQRYKQTNITERFTKAEDVRGEVNDLKKKEQPMARNMEKSIKMKTFKDANHNYLPGFEAYSHRLLILSGSFWQGKSPAPLPLETLEPWKMTSRDESPRGRPGAKMEKNEETFWVWVNWKKINRSIEILCLRKTSP